MRIHLRNIAAFAFVVVILVLLVRHGGAVARVTGDVERIGPGHSMDERTVGLLALGFIAVSIVAIIKLLTQPSTSDRHHRRTTRWEDPDN